MHGIDENQKQGPILKNSPYGFKVNINHPSVTPLYKRYKLWRGIPENCPLSDDQRLEFESYILPKMKGEEK